MIVSPEMWGCLFMKQYFPYNPATAHKRNTGFFSWLGQTSEFQLLGLLA